MTASREDVYQHLVEVHGEEGARAIMAMLPPSRWEDLATKADVRALEARIDGIDQRLASMEHSLSGQLAALQTSLEGELATLRAVTVSGRQIGLTMAASVAAIGALAVALAALLA